jgi:hypothetical protein
MKPRNYFKNNYKQLILKEANLVELMTEIDESGYNAIEKMRGQNPEKILETIEQGLGTKTKCKCNKYK